MEGNREECEGSDDAEGREVGVVGISTSVEGEGEERGERRSICRCSLYLDLKMID